MRLFKIDDIFVHGRPQQNAYRRQVSQSFENAVNDSQSVEGQHKQKNIQWSNLPENTNQHSSIIVESENIEKSMLTRNESAVESLEKMDCLIDLFEDEIEAQDDYRKKLDFYGWSLSIDSDESLDPPMENNQMHKLRKLNTQTDFDDTCIDLFSVKVLVLLLCQDPAHVKADLLFDLVVDKVVTNDEESVIELSNKRLKRAIMLLTFFSELFPKMCLN